VVIEHACSATKNKITFSLYDSPREWQLTMKKGSLKRLIIIIYKKKLQVTFYDPQVAWTVLGHYTKSTRLLQPR
jgi:hypothetical protein